MEQNLKQCKTCKEFKRIPNWSSICYNCKYNEPRKQRKTLGAKPEDNIKLLVDRIKKRDKNDSKDL